MAREARNVALLCLDTVRADYFREHAPRLREHAGLVYEQCRAASSWSVPSHASMFTGELPHRHGIHTYNRDFSGLERADTFLADLPDHRAVAASANVWAGPAFGFDGLFDDFRAVSPDRRFPDGLDVARFGQEVEAEGPGKYLAFLRAAATHDHPLRSLANGAFVQLDDWLVRAPVPKLLDDGARTICREARRGALAGREPFFLFANLMDAHGPLHHVRGYDRGLHDAPHTWTSEDVDWGELLADAGDRPAEWPAEVTEQVERYRGLYAAAVDYLDRTVLAFVEGLLDATDRETTVVVTADHGDNLAFEADDGWGHVESSLAEGLLHVPLVVLNPPGDPDRVETGLVSHCALPDLLAGLAGGTVPDVTADRILAERVGHSGRLADVEDRRGTRADRMLRVVYEGDRDRKLVWDSLGGRESYALDADRPCWQAPLGDDFDADALDERFFDVPVAEYKERAAAAASGPAVDDATRERLEDLGYV